MQRSRGTLDGGGVKTQAPLSNLICGGRSHIPGDEAGRTTAAGEPRSRGAAQGGRARPCKCISDAPGRVAQRAPRRDAGVQPGAALMTDAYALYHRIDRGPPRGRLGGRTPVRRASVKAGESAPRAARTSARRATRWVAPPGKRFAAGVRGASWTRARRQRLRARHSARRPAVLQARRVKRQSGEVASSQSGRA